MKKTALFLVVILTVSVFAFASCSKLPWFNKECTEHVDENADYICDNCESELQKPDNSGDSGNSDKPNEPYACEHKDENNDHKCDICNELQSECADAGRDHKCDICGADMGDHEAEAGKHRCNYCGKVLTYCTDEDENNLCDVCGTDVETVNYSLNISDVPTGTLSADFIGSKYTIVSGTEIRNRTKTFEGVEYTKSVKIGNSTAKIKVEVPGNGMLSFLVQNGSSSATTQFIKVTAPDGTVYDLEFDGANNGSPVVKIEVPVTPGEWVISRGKNSGTQDIYYLELKSVVEKSEECDFEVVSQGKTEYLIGEEFDTSRLVLNGVYESGKTEPLSLSDVTIDSSAFDNTKAGAYTIVISYKNYEPITYTVNVYSTNSIDLGFDAIEQLKQNSSAGNGVYFNHSFQEVYVIGEELNLKGLSVTSVTNNADGTTKKFLIDLSEVSVTGFDSTTAGEKVLTISYQGAIAKVSVYVVDTAPSVVNEVYQVKVDASYKETIGAVSGGYNMFSTIQQALDFLANAPAEAKKVIEIADGEYDEKLEITIPNLTIKGAGADKVIIEWDSLYGIADEGGFVHTTDSTATVAVRDAAVNLTIEGVTISNKYNSLAYFDKTLGAGYGEHRALALLVQSDRFVMKNSSLLGYQDTVEFFTGRQYLYNVYISGTTDFIFGTNNTTLFENCQIHSITNGKTDGGYVTAFKGSNKGAGDAIKYGAIFYKCNFTADSDVLANKNTALGRGWGAYAAVAIIECEIGSHISTKGFTGSSKNERYVSMAGVKPTDATVQFVEYGNTGAGAISDAVAGMTMLTAEEAALYSNISVIFGTINGKVSYLDPWNPNSNVEQVDDRTYYMFNGQSATSGTGYTYTGELNGTTGTFGDIAIDATAGKVSARTQGDTQINAGAKLTFNVSAGTVVTVVTYPGYSGYTLNGVANSAESTFSRYYAEDTTVVFEATATVYLYQIIINPNESAPDAPKLEEIKATGLLVNYTVGDALSLNGVVVYAYYDDFSVVPVDYDVDTSAVDNLNAGTYDVVFSYGGKSTIVSVTFEGENADPAITVDTVLGFDSDDNFNAVLNNKRVTVNEADFRRNGDNTQVASGATISFQVKAGATVTVVPYNNSQYVAYTLGAEGETGLVTKDSNYSYTATEDCTIVYTSMSVSNYILSIHINYPAVVDSDTTINFGSNGNYKDVKGVNIANASIRDNGGNNSQISSGSISFSVKAGATVTVNGYPGYTSYTFGDGTTTSDEINAELYVYTAESDVEITLTAVNGNNYFYSIIITY